MPLTARLYWKQTIRKLEQIRRKAPKLALAKVNQDAQHSGRGTLEENQTRSPKSIVIGCSPVETNVRETKGTPMVHMHGRKAKESNEASGFLQRRLPLVVPAISKGKVVLNSKVLNSNLLLCEKLGVIINLRLRFPGKNCAKITECMQSKKRPIWAKRMRRNKLNFAESVCIWWEISLSQ